MVKARNSGVTYLRISRAKCTEEEITRTTLLTSGHKLRHVVQRLVTRNGQHLVGAELQLQLLQLIMRLVRDAELEGHAHEARESLQPRHDLLHHLQRRLLRRDHDGAEPEVRRPVRPRGQHLQQRGPLRAVRVAHVHDVDLHLPLERLHHRCVPRHMPKRRPRTRLLDNQIRFRSTLRSTAHLTKPQAYNMSDRVIHLCLTLFRHHPTIPLLQDIVDTVLGMSHLFRKWEK